MLSSRHLSKGFAKYLSPKIVAVPAGGKVSHTPVEDKHHHGDPDTTKIATQLTKSGVTSILRQVPVPKLQKRFSHNDIRVPDFDAYRKDACKDPTAQSQANDKNIFSYVVVAGMGSIGAYGFKNLAHGALESWSFSGSTLAVGAVEVNLLDIPLGKNVVIKWRGKPLFIRHRTAEEIADAQNQDISVLRDPQRDQDRVHRDDFLILIGVCTHLGCVPISNAGDFGGYYCPCHGSHYDTSGRIRQGPAPLNLEIPNPLEFLDENTIKVG